ncbi:MAG: ral nucleoside transport system permease protein [Kosmotoga sp.]|nr:ral nucleoside transport system permease protein [Kosmotoga sp.]
MSELLSITTDLAKAAVRAGTPLLFAAAGELLTERSGVLNLGIEGTMLMGAITGFAVAVQTGNPYFGILAAAVVGAIFGYIYSLFVVNMGLNQVVTGLAFMMIGTGLSGYIGRAYVGIGLKNSLKPLEIPYLSKIPVLGKALFSQDILVYSSIILIALLHYWLFKTQNGLHLRSVGESPETADFTGINVFLTRQFATSLGAAIIAVGGAYISIAYSPLWVENMTAGRGWIALALVIFAGWRPWRALLGAYLFGGISALQYRAQVLNVKLSPYIMDMFPYLLTVLIMIFISSEAARRKLGAPSAIGIPYRRR